MVDHIADEVDQMILGQPFTQARRKQKPLFWKVRTVALAHDSLCTTPIPVPPAQSLLSTGGLSQTHLTSPTDYFSDTLLGSLRTRQSLDRRRERALTVAVVLPCSSLGDQAWCCANSVPSGFEPRANLGPRKWHRYRRSFAS